VLGYIIFSLPEKYRVIRINDGFAALSVTLLVYGFTEMINGYGFIAVFVSAVTMRNVEMEHKLHRKLHAFTDQIERILVAITLLLFGGSLVNGLMDYLTWPLGIFGLVFIFLIRPVTTWLSLIGARLHYKERWAISFFGIRGIGSFFYMAFALQQAKFTFARELWSLVAFIVLMSIIIHGLTAGTVMKKIDDEFNNPDA
jgi:NhaP-type Na+/H+ or K+/H+ antiporter